jgi:3-hydroxy-9,10-secoandrosta-1,3,5(10)-triene-9,17-dione monooxygenase reductase component
MAAMTIHGDHPFLPPESERSPVRRLRGRLTSPVALWTSGSAGLPVTSMLVADGSPALVVGLVDEDSELWAAMSRTSVLVVSLLSWEHRGLADAFAGTMPAPGGPFRLTSWEETSWGPVPSSAATWAGCRLLDSRSTGWAVEARGTLEQVTVGDDRSPLLHRRGRYLTLPNGAADDD